MGASALWLAASFVVLVAAGSGCSRRATQLVVVVESDLLPADLACVHVSVTRVGTMDPPAEQWFYVERAGTPAVELPFSFGVTPPDQDPARRVEVEVSAVRDGCGADALDVTQVSVVDRVRTGFLPEQALRLPVYLSRSCVALSCPAGSTCRGGTCVGLTREAGPLEAIEDGGELGPRAPVNYAFVTSGTFDGALGGAAGADAICEREAREAGLSGTFVALLGTGASDPTARLGTASGWVRTDGRVVATSRDALGSEPLVHPLLLDALGRRVLGGNTNAWINSPAAMGDCVGWTSSDPTLLGAIGDYTQVLGGDWLAPTAAGYCDRPQHLYCFQTDYAIGAPPTEPIEGGRRIFVSDASTASPDAACALSAARGGPPLAGATFRAVVAMTGVAAIDRIDLDERPWVRLDGRVVFLDATNVRSDLPRVPVLFDATGTAGPSGYTVFTGAGGNISSPGLGVTRPGTAASTCDDWTRTSGPQPALASASTGADWFFQGSGSACSPMRRYYCLED